LDTAEMDNIIDIVAVGRASLPLARWWQRFLADPDAAGEHLDDLEEARARLRELGPVPGRVGRAIAVVVMGGGATAAQSVEAIELLNGLADHVAAQGPTDPGPPTRPARIPRGRARTGHRGDQQTLPGM
ncbi:MAG TPA: hypothetical protein VK988_08320, partial [Acidimicrobiales bacterium]|nr:hypothetical protein [Acidimicrobiales bacterium]